MTSVFLKRWLALLAILATSLSMVGCKVGGGSGGAGQSSIRALNLTNDLASLDLYLANNLQFSALNTGVLNTYAAVDTNTYAISIHSAGNSGALFTGTYTLAKDAHYTAVVWGPQSSLHISTLPEDDDTTLIAAGNTRVRMFNATTATGALDVYLTAPGADLTQTTPTQALLTGGSLAGFKEIPQGTYQLTVTGAGNPADIRLSVSSVALTAAQYATVVLTPGSGGLLVNGTLVVEQGNATSLPNTQARVRLVASVDSAGVVGAYVSGTPLAGGLLSPAIGQYTLVNAGAVPVVIRVNGNIALTGQMTFNAGADYTLLAYGPPATSHLTVITDDNRLPLSTTRAKIRLVNGVANLDPLTMLVDYGAVAASSNIAAGTAATYQEIASDTQAVIEVDSPTLGAVYLTTRTNGDNLAAQGVYTLFVLGGKAAPFGTLRNERP